MFVEHCDFNRMLQRLAEKSRTNAQCENWNFLLKRKDHKMARMRTDEFLLSQSRVMLGRQRLFVDGLSEKSKDKLKVCLNCSHINYDM